MYTDSLDSSRIEKNAYPLLGIEPRPQPVAYSFPHIRENTFFSQKSTDLNSTISLSLGNIKLIGKILCTILNLFDL